MTEDSRLQWDEALLWIEKAHADLTGARGLLAIDLTELAAFHVQQAAEKTLKAMLVAAAQDILRTHDIDTLATLARTHWPDLLPDPFPLTALSQWYVTTRYPGIDEATPTSTEVTDALAAVQDLIRQFTGRSPR